MLYDPNCSQPCGWTFTHQTSSPERLTGVFRLASGCFGHSLGFWWFRSLGKHGMEPEVLTGRRTLTSRLTFCRGCIPSAQPKTWTSRFRFCGGLCRLENTWRGCHRFGCEVICMVGFPFSHFFRFNLHRILDSMNIHAWI